MTLALSGSQLIDRRFPRATVLIVSAILLAVGGAIWLYGWIHSGPIVSKESFFTVVPTDLDVVIRKDGELTSVTNTDVLSPVEGMMTIRMIVPEGKTVKKGETVAELDASDMKTKLQSALLDVEKGESDATAAKEELSIQKSKNDADLDAAQVELKLAKIDLKAYTEGIYPQSLQAAQRDLEMAKITLADKQQVLSDSKSLQTKGFITSSDVRKAEEDLVQAQSDTEKKQVDLRVLTDYTHEKDLADKDDKVAQAERKVQRTIAENASQLSQKVADQQTKEQSLFLYKQTQQHLQEQVDSCTVKAPSDGVVIYGSSAMPDWFQTPIQPGGKISDQQLLIRLPDTSHMKAVVKIPEAMALKLRGQDVTKLDVSVEIVGVGDPVPATITSVAVLPDNSNRWWNPDRKDYPVDLTLSRTPINLKPGVTVHAQIIVAHLANVLAAPLAAIYSDGDDHFVFIHRGDHNHPQRVTIGQVTDTQVELKDGVSEGDQILILEAGQGRDLVEGAGMKHGATTKPTIGKPSNPATNPATLPTTLPTTVPTTAPATQPTSHPTLQAGSAPATAPTTAPVSPASTHPTA